MIEEKGHNSFLVKDFRTLVKVQKFGILPLRVGPVKV